MHAPTFMPVLLLYLDPGTGSLIIQLIIAGLLGILVIFRTTLARFLSWVKKLLRRDKGADREDQ